MKTKEIRDLIDFISKSGLNEVNIETDELKLSVKRNADVQTQIVESGAVHPVAAPVVNANPYVPSIPAAKPAEDNTPGEEQTVKYAEIKSPMIGTFYRSPNPESDSFIKVGDTVSSGQTVCVIEAMKLFNEIEAEIGGTIIKVLVEDASPVEYDQPLCLVDPA